ncbi:hypothetical protein EGW08_016931 [Elysia chlorotica]|uniref:Uncharacterized protein n=1 Tax=Elysia chlorotica TaxID=188477 RepID=A0A433T186_ELYCH|nr:hypothetical protein EGW08_016931 [Elysia chlorotica]
MVTRRSFEVIFTQSKIIRNSTKENGTKRNVFARRRKPVTVPHKVDSEEIRKGQVVSEARESDDVERAVAKRLARWPEGNEIVALLMLLKTEQVCASYCPSAPLSLKRPTSEDSFATN